MGWYSTRRALLSGREDLIRRMLCNEVDPKRSVQVAMGHMTPDEVEQATRNLAAYNARSKKRFREDAEAVERFLNP